MSTPLAQSPVYATREAIKQARELGVAVIEVEVGARLNRLTPWNREHAIRDRGSLWIHTTAWSAKVRRGPARLDPRRKAWHVVEVRSP